MAYYSSGLRMNKLQLRKHGTSQCWATEFGLESTQAIWFQPHMVPGGPESSVLLEVQMVTIWKRQDSVTEREPNMLAMFYSWSGDIPDLGTGSAGVPFRRAQPRRGPKGYRDQSLCPLPQLQKLMRVYFFNKFPLNGIKRERRSHLPNPRIVWFHEIIPWGCVIVSSNLSWAFGLHPAHRHLLSQPRVSWNA